MNNSVPACKQQGGRLHQQKAHLLTGAPCPLFPQCPALSAGGWAAHPPWELSSTPPPQWTSPGRESQQQQHGTSSSSISACAKGSSSSGSRQQWCCQGGSNSHVAHFWSDCGLHPAASELNMSTWHNYALKHTCRIMHCSLPLHTNRETERVGTMQPVVMRSPESAQFVCVL